MRQVAPVVAGANPALHGGRVRFLCPRCFIERKGFTMRDRPLAILLLLPLVCAGPIVVTESMVGYDIRISDMATDWPGKGSLQSRPSPLMPPLARAFSPALEPFPCPVSAFDPVASSIEEKGNTYQPSPPVE